tara:strand:- start:3226 stop:4713 length:1488 start_codon:yes stop_codon:yes gene_type:complete
MIKTDKIIFYASLFALVSCITPIILWSQDSYQILLSLKVSIENTFGSTYQMLTIVVLLFVLWLAFSKYGTIQLGEGEYQFKTFSWASMLFCAGVATGILYWGTIEWAYYYDSPPFGIEPRSTLAIEYAATYGMFHWGIAGWAFYCLPAIALSYMYYVKRVPFLKISNSCRGLIGDHADGMPGQIIDVLFMVGLLGSTGTSMGLGIPMIAAGIESVFGIPDTFSLKVVVILFCAVIVSISVYLGLARGIKRLSNFNTTAAFIFLAFVFISGPTVFILKMGLNSFGLVVKEFVRMITWTDPLTDSRFVEDWSIFYWSWWVAVGPFNGMFITKISKGRTIRQVILGTLFFGSMGCAIFYNILGNYALSLELSGQFITTQLIHLGKAASAISGVVGSLPGEHLTIFLFTLMSIVFMATTFDSTSYALALCATEKLEPDQEPARWQRLFWSFTLVILPLSLIYIGGLESLKLVVLISALPLIFVYIMMGVSLLINLRNHK